MFIESGLLDPDGLLPALYLRADGAVHLFDCGVTHVPRAFGGGLECVHISHMHMDHFCHIDGIFALCLHSARKRLRVFGPPGILASVRAKLSAYTWNLLEAGTLVIDVLETDGATASECSVIVPDRIEGGPAIPVSIEHGVIHRGAEYVMRCLPMNHQILSLGYSFEEVDSFGVSDARLAASGLAAGPWLKELKQRAVERKPGDIPVAGEMRPFAELERLLDPKKGKKIVYLTDFFLEEATFDRIVGFAKGTDILYCEANYLEADIDLARTNHHLTARQAGEIARAAGVGELVLFHVSPKYERRLAVEEAARTFGAVR